MNNSSNSLRNVTELEFQLKQPFDFDEIEWRIGSSYERNGEVKALALPYVTSRAIMDRLDSVFGIDGWEDEYQPWGNNAQLCAITVRIGERSVKKWDGAEMTDYESVKGGLSNALKRTAVKFGIGRYLYSFDQIWVKCEVRGKTKVIAKDEFATTLANFYRNQLTKIFNNASSNAQKNNNSRNVTESTNYNNVQTNNAGSVWENRSTGNSSNKNNMYANNQNENGSSNNKQVNNNTNKFNNSVVNEQTVKPKVPVAFLNFIKLRINETGKELNAILGHYKVGSLEELTMVQANDLVAKLG